MIVRTVAISSVGRMRRQRDEAEGLPRAGAVHPRRAVVGLGDRLAAPPAGAAPATERCATRSRSTAMPMAVSGLLEPRDRAVGEPERVGDIGHDAERRLEHEAPVEAGHDRGDGPRQQERDADDAPRSATRRFMTSAAAIASGTVTIVVPAAKMIVRGIESRNCVVGRQPEREVVEADERRRSRPQELDPEDAHPEHGEDGREDEQPDEEDCRDEQQQREPWLAEPVQAAGEPDAASGGLRGRGRHAAGASLTSLLRCPQTGHARGALGEPSRTGRPAELTAPTKRP